MTKRRIRMLNADVEIGGKRLRYSISDNTGANLWAINIHGFLAGGGVYWRESTRLAARLGLRMVNPNMPAFAGSEALHWDDLTMHNFSSVLIGLMDHLEIDRALLLGHSMGGGIAVQITHDYPERVAGVVYRDGVATSSWKQRSGLFKRIFDPISPDVGSALDLGYSALIDVPDFLYSRASSMLSTAAPDVRQNARNLLDTAPVFAMLLFTDLTPLVEELGRRTDLPLLPMWGRFDRLIPAKTAHEFAEISGRGIHWVWGGHSWMIPRPNTTSEYLTTSPEGAEFLHNVFERAGTASPASI